MEPTREDLCRFLLLPPSQRDRAAHRDAFEHFLGEAGRLFALREAAWERFQKNPWLAQRERGALPLTWAGVTRVLSPNYDEPRAGLETRLAHTLPAVLLSVYDHLRNVLRRDRELVQVGRVEQFDSTSLRWLMRQPGHNVAQKAGSRQRVLAVVRRENFNILENRVLRELLVRTQSLSELWLRENERFKGRRNATYESVSRLSALCRKGLDLEAMRGVASLKEVPKPNYVLSQDALYRRVWDAYLNVIQRFRLLEGLWDRREELSGSLQKWALDARKYKDSYFQTELWVCFIQDRKPWAESYPEVPAFPLCKPPIPTPTPEDGHCVLDLCGLLYADILLTPDLKLHPNACPRRLNFNSPVVDFDPSRENEEIIRRRVHKISDLIQSRNGTYLQYYFRQLVGEIGGDVWTILVPDEWRDDILETIVRAAEGAAGRKVEIRLLWRTVAYALGLGTHPFTVFVRRLDHRWDCASFKYDNGILFREFKQIGRGKREGRTYPSQTETLFRPEWAADKTDWNTYQILKSGANIVHRDLTAGRTAYYDELPGLYAVVQTEDEHVRFETLIAYNRRHPGGTAYQGNEMRYQMDQSDESMRLYFLHASTPVPKSEDLLSLFQQKLQRKNTSQVLHLRPSGVPGRGVMKLMVRHEGLQHSEEVFNLSGRAVSLPGETLSSLEENLDRSFPPIVPQVRSCRYFLQSKEYDDLKDYLEHRGKKLDGGIFCKRFYRNKLDSGESALERLRRYNVFGLEEKSRIPSDENSGYWPKRISLPSLRNGVWNLNYDMLFARLAAQAAGEFIDGHYNGAVRLIAWTYAQDCVRFNRLRNQCIQKIKNGSLDPVLITFCSNLCSHSYEWIELLEVIRKGLQMEKGESSLERLLQNLLMYNPDFIPKTGLAENKTLTSWLVERLCSDARRGFPAQKSYCFKSLLFLLRVRLFDKKRFATEEHDPRNYQLIKNVCELPGQPAIARVVLRYLDGSGRINDLPAVLKDSDD